MTGPSPDWPCVDHARDIADMRVAHAELNACVKQLGHAVGQLTPVVQELRDTLNKSRGALWAIMSAAALAGALASKIVAYLSREL